MKKVMDLVVMKFGGTSVVTKKNRALAIKHVARELKAGNKALVVVSAMGRIGEPYATDTLLSLLSDGADKQTRDLLMSCGETISTCVFADELRQRGIPAIAFTGESAGIVTTDAFGEAEITAIDTKNMRAALEKGFVPVITGFQGRTKDHMTATLGRGGSDTSAVVIGGYLHADSVDIYTDVPGIAKADPRVVPHADFLCKIRNADMLELAQWGSGVIHHKAVAAGAALGVPVLRVRSTFDDTQGTCIATEGETEGFAGLAILKNMSETTDGAYTVCNKRYGKAEGGSYAILTAIHSCFSDKQCAAIKAIAREFESNEHVLRMIIPMEEASDAAKAVYDILNEG